ncbi:hypothetical protein K0M31_002885 [Melipona bicolor]|uniref:Uncharacterized protein n=1 Tax=Melipona bicolor TaxID=60889 RepID=A0AA40G0T5_9HYME|nr:hypothetical protein K0M31_002885 [Melipona bicolor]
MRQYEQDKRESMSMRNFGNSKNANRSTSRVEARNFLSAPIPDDFFRELSTKILEEKPALLLFYPEILESTKIRGIKCFKMIYKKRRGMKRGEKRRRKRGWKGSAGVVRFDERASIENCQEVGEEDERKRNLWDKCSPWMRLVVVSRSSCPKASEIEAPRFPPATLLLDARPTSPFDEKLFLALGERGSSEGNRGEDGCINPLRLVWRPPPSSGSQDCYD